MFDEEEINTDWVPDSTRAVGESVGIPSMPDDAARHLADDVTFRLKELIQSAKKATENARRIRMTTDDVDRGLRYKGAEPLYGFGAPDFIPFRYASGGGRDVYFNEDKEVELAQIINSSVPKAPLQVTLKAHWLAIDGIQPLIPENPIEGSSGADSLNAGKSKAGDKRSALAKRRSHGGDEMVNLKSVATHQLSVEQQFYYKEITEACVGPDEKKRGEALQSLAFDTGLQAVLPRIVVFVSEGIKLNVVQNNLAILIYLMRMMKSLIDNPAVNLEKHLHDLIPGMLSCVLAKQLVGRPEQEYHWALRDFAGKVLSLLCKAYSATVSDLQSRVTNVLTDAMQSPRSYISTIYGALSTYSEMGNEVVRTLVVPQCQLITDRLRRLEAFPPSSSEMDGVARTKKLVEKMLTSAFKSAQPPMSELELRDRIGDYFFPTVWLNLQTIRQQHFMSSGAMGGLSVATGGGGYGGMGQMMPHGGYSTRVGGLASPLTRTSSIGSSSGAGKSFPSNLAGSHHQYGGYPSSQFPSPTPSQFLSTAGSGGSSFPFSPTPMLSTQPAGATNYGNPSTAFGGSTNFGGLTPSGASGLGAAPPPQRVVVLKAAPGTGHGHGDGPGVGSSSGVGILSTKFSSGPSLTPAMTTLGSGNVLTRTFSASGESGQTLSTNPNASEISPAGSLPGWAPNSGPGTGSVPGADDHQYGSVSGTFVSGSGPAVTGGSGSRAVRVGTPNQPTISGRIISVRLGGGSVSSRCNSPSASSAASKSPVSVIDITEEQS